MILTGPAIREQVELGNIEIDPYVPEHVNQASVDLTLGDTIAKYRQPSQHEMVAALRSAWEHGMEFPSQWVLDSRKENPVDYLHIPTPGFVLFPGELYLMHTVERVRTDKYAIMIDGKSSLGRLGVLVHLTAGYVDPSFDGQYTLEVVTFVPVRLYAGMRVCQIRFHALEGALESYQERGNYVGERATGPVASQSWRQFSK